MNFINHQLHRWFVANYEHTWHKQSISHSLIGKARNSSSVVRDQDATFIGSPSQNVCILCRPLSNVGNPNNIKFGSLSFQASKDIVIEIGISRQAMHLYSS